jgi:hypothetical protein
MRPTGGEVPRAPGAADRALPLPVVKERDLCLEDPREKLQPDPETQRTALSGAINVKEMTSLLRLSPNL